MSDNQPAETRVRPFSCGTQSVDWDERNCCRCAKANFDKGASECSIAIALCEAYWGDGTVSTEIAHRMGCDNPLAHYNWDCIERVPDEGGA